MNQKLLGVAGIIVILGIAFVLSGNRKAIRLRVVGAAFALQAFIAWLVIYTSWGRAGMRWTPGGTSSVRASVRGVSRVVNISSVPAKLWTGTPRCLVAPAAGSRSMMRLL